jgi:hypothetical protein
VRAIANAKIFRTIVISSSSLYFSYRLFPLERKIKKCATSTRERHKP